MTGIREFLSNGESKTSTTKRCIPLYHNLRKLTTEQVKKVEDDQLICMVKYDGVSGIVATKDGETRIFSSSGKPFSESSLSVIYKLLEPVKDKLEGLCLQIEILNDRLSLQELAGAISPRRTKELPDEMVEILQETYMVVFDCVSVSEFLATVSYTPFYQRLAQVEQIVQSTKTFVRPSYLNVKSIEDATRFFDSYMELTNNKGEGIVLAQTHAPWVASKRGFTKTKMVRQECLDLRIVGVKDGKGKHKDTLSLLVVQWRDYGNLDKPLTQLEVDVAWTDQERKTWWAQAHDLIGKIVEVHALGVDSKGALRLPKAKLLRLDKHSCDMEIKR